MLYKDNAIAFYTQRISTPIQGLSSTYLVVRHVGDEMLHELKQLFFSQVCHSLDLERFATLLPEIIQCIVSHLFKPHHRPKSPSIDCIRVIDVVFRCSRQLKLRSCKPQVSDITAGGVSVSCRQTSSGTTGFRWSRPAPAHCKCCRESFPLCSARSARK